MEIIRVEQRRQGIFRRVQVEMPNCRWVRWLK